MTAYISLSGHWTGVYDYFESESVDGHETLAVPFQAIIIETAGQITGHIDEPDTFNFSAINLQAHINGTRNGKEVQFVKEYPYEGFNDYFIRYDGSVDKEVIQIEGIWTTIEPDGYSWSGPFKMNRAQPDKAEKAQEAGAELLVK